MTGQCADTGRLVLIVDDEEFMLRAMKDALEAFEYRVITARNGSEAIVCYTEHHRQIAAVILDMTMPVMDGPATLRALQTVNPHVKVIASTGAIPSKSLSDSVRAILYKPYTTQTLIRTVAEVIG